jgi:CelD/BcsL family acetyltransferase involved in cellulose biosynthesis
MLRAPALTTGRVPVDETLAGEWDRLADAAGTVPFARPGWVLPWCRYREAAPEAVVVRRGPELAALLPVIGNRPALRTTADWHTPWIETVADDDEARRFLAETVAGLGLRRVSVDFVERPSADADACDVALRRAGYSVLSRTRLQSPFITLDGDWTGYLASLSARKRSELRRRTRRLAEEGAVTVDVHDGSADLEGLLAEGFSVEASGWKGSRGTAIAASRRRADFYRQVAAWAEDRGWLRLSFLRVGGRAAAFDLSLETDRRHYLLKTGFCPEYGRFAPGMLLRARMIERAFGLGLDTYEFTGQVEPWKLEWTGATREIVLIDAFAPGPAGWLHRQAARGLRLLRSRLRR